MEDDAEIHENLDEKAENLQRLHEFFDVVILGYSKSFLINVDKCSSFVQY